MKKIYVLLISCIFIFNATLRGNDNSDYPFVSTVKCEGMNMPLNNGMNFSGKRFEKIDITRENKVLKNVDFSNCYFKDCSILEVVFENCNFSGAIFDGGYIHIHGSSINFSNVLLKNRCMFNSTSSIFSQSLNFKSKRIENIVFAGGGYGNSDFSNCEFHKIPEMPPSYSCAVYQNAYFSEVSLKHDPDFTSEQLKQSRNYRLGFFYKISMPTNLTSPIDYSEMLFVKSCLGGNVKEAIFNNAKFINSGFPWDVRGLTSGQIKSTWNYKNNRMDLLYLPKELRKEFPDSKPAPGEEDKEPLKDDIKPFFEHVGVGLLENVEGKTFYLTSNCSIEKQRFHHIYYEYFPVNNVSVLNCEFVDCVLLILPENSNFSDTIFDGGHIVILGNSNIFNDVELKGRLRLDISDKCFIQTKNYKRKKLDNLTLECARFQKVDFSNFTFHAVQLNDLQASAVRFDNAWFSSMKLPYCIPSGFPRKQFFNSQNYKLGIFSELELCNDVGKNGDFSKMIFYSTTFKGSVKNTQFSNAIFVESGFDWTVTDLTIEQIKSTWNYKNDRMDLITLPPDLQKYFDEEKKTATPGDSVKKDESH